MAGTNQPPYLVLEHTTGADSSGQGRASATDIREATYELAGSLHALAAAVCSCGVFKNQVGWLIGSCHLGVF